MNRITRHVLATVGAASIVAGTVLTATAPASANSSDYWAYTPRNIVATSNASGITFTADPDCGGPRLARCELVVRGASVSSPGWHDMVAGSQPWPSWVLPGENLSVYAFSKATSRDGGTVEKWTMARVLLRPGHTVAPLAVSTPVDGSVVTERRPVFSGTGDEGARIEIRGTTRTVATTTVVNGRWSVPADFDLDDGHYALTVTQTATTGATDTKPVSFTVAATHRPLTLIDPVAGQQYLPDQPYTFRGTASPFAKIRAEEDDEELFTATADADGNWTATRPWGSTRTWHIDITQYPLVGDPDSIRDFVWAPIDTK